MKMAVSFQYGDDITALTIRVTYSIPRVMLFGGCSRSWSVGATQETCGSVPFFRSVKRVFESGLCWLRYAPPLRVTEVKKGAGFHMDGVPGFCGFAAQVISSSSQSGWEPPVT